MRSIIIPLLVLLFSMRGAQTQSTQTEVQTESTGADVIQVDVYAELKELRDMVVEQRALLSDTQNEVETLRTKNSVLETEVAVLKTRLAACETEMMNLRKETAAHAERLAVTETDMAYVKKDTAALQTDLTTMKTEVMNLKMVNAAQDTRLSASETEIENLKMINEAQKAELTTVKTRLSATETEVENLKMKTAAQEAELTEVKTRLADTETDVVNLEKEITEQPKVAFSAGLTNSGYIQAGNTELNLVFTKIITNVGQAYSSTTGFFTAPVRGVYYFRFTVMDVLSSRWMEIRMHKNGDRIMLVDEYDSDGHHTYLSGGVTLELEVGDVVNLCIPAGYRLYDNIYNRSMFSGFLLFPL